jgi:hypothetical protein
MAALRCRLGAPLNADSVQRPPRRVPQWRRGLGVWAPWSYTAARRKALRRGAAAPLTIVPPHEGGGVRSPGDRIPMGGVYSAGRPRHEAGSGSGCG